jgi:hypothetical protein
MIDWVVYYKKQTTFTDEEGDPVDVPPWGVQVIAQADDRVGRRLVSKKDYYLFVDGQWVGVDFTGLIDYLANVLGIVKVGRMIDRQEYRDILEQARIDQLGLPPKSGWLQDEPRG